MTRRRLVLCAGAVALLAGCGTDATGVVQAGDTLAALDVIDTAAEHRPVTASVFTPAVDGAQLEAGDTVRTDATGFAEVQYADGSLTRLGAETTLTVVVLDGDVTVPEIELDLDVGRVWNRVNTVTGERGRYEVTTDVGTAAVRGTAFSIDCTPEPVCTFVVTEGVVVVFTLDGRELVIEAGEVVTLGRDDDEAIGAGGEDGAGGDGGEATDGDGGPSGVTVELARSELDVDGDSPAATWTGLNGPLDLATGRFDVDDQQRCSVTVAGRNLDHATTPETAIEAKIDETLRIDAVATGPLDTYTVDLHLAGLRLRAAQGEVLPDASGDRTTFRGEIDVGEYAEWGVGLYEVTAATTGTVCLARAFIDVTGRNPLTTGTGILAILLLLGGLGGLTLALNSATMTGTTGTTSGSSGSTTGSTTTSTSLWSKFTGFFTGGG